MSFDGADDVDYRSLNSTTSSLTIADSSSARSSPLPRSLDDFQRTFDEIPRRSISSLSFIDDDEIDSHRAHVINERRHDDDNDNRLIEINDS